MKKNSKTPNKNKSIHAKPKAVKPKTKVNDQVNSLVIEALKKVQDPEIGVDIYTLGLVYKITIVKSKVKILMTLTSRACPMGDQIMADVKHYVGQVQGIKEVEVKLTFTPQWKASPELRLQMGLI